MVACGQTKCLKAFQLYPKSVTLTRISNRRMTVLPSSVDRIGWEQDEIW